MVLDRIRTAVGDDYPVCYRMSADEYVQGGLTIEDTALFSRMLAERGVNAISVSGGVYESSKMIVQSPLVADGVFADNAAVIKAFIKAAIPVIVAGNIKDPYTAEKILEEGSADMIGLARALLVDADFPRKAQTGKAQEIDTCTGCNQGCIERLFAGQDISCTISDD